MACRCVRRAGQRALSAAPRFWWRPERSASAVMLWPEIEWTLIDEEYHAPLNQALAVVTTSANPDLERRFAAYVNGEKGRPIMRRYGFSLPGEEPLRTQDLQP